MHIADTSHWYYRGGGGSEIDRGKSEEGSKWPDGACTQLYSRQNPLKYGKYILLLVVHGYDWPEHVIHSPVKVSQRRPIIGKYVLYHIVCYWVYSNRLSVDANPRLKYSA
jgi:hypothetical protein